MSLPNNPQTRKEMYLSNMAGQGTPLPEAPITREEAYLDVIAKQGGGGSTGDGDMKKSVYDSDLAVLSAGGIKSFVAEQTAGKADKSEIPENTSDLTNDSGFITNTVNNLANYYLKTQTYTQAEVDALIAAVKNGRFISVATLPTTDIDTKAIYLVPSADPKTGNIKDEYINTDGTSAGWELIGSTAIDLSGYVTDAELTTALADYTTTTDLTTLLAGKMPNYGIGTGLYVDSGTNELRADAVTLAIKDSPKLITSGAVFSGLGPKYGTADQLETELDGQDKFPFYDFSASEKRQVTFGSIKAKLKEYFDLFYTNLVSSATNGNFAGLDANGNLVDSGKKASDFATTGNAIANTKLIKDTVGWSGKNKLPITLSKLKELNTGGTWVDNVYTFKGLTFTIAHDGDSVISITQTGTSTGSGYLYLGYLPLKNGDSFILNGSASNSSGTTTYMRVGKGGTEGSFVLSSIGGAETSVNISEDNNYSINIACGLAGMTGTYVWKPMLRDANILDNTYEPYHESVEDYAFPRSEQAVLGAKNIMPYPYASVPNENNGIAWTENKGKVTASGIATGNSTFTLTDFGYIPNNYIGMKLTGCPAGGSFSGYRILVNYSNDGTNWVKSNSDIGEGCIIENYPYIDIKAYISNGTDLSTPKTFEPMISFDGGEYVPPVMTNKELTNAVAVKNDATQITSDNMTIEYCIIAKAGKIRACTIKATANANITAMATIFKGFPDALLEAIDCHTSAEFVNASDNSLYPVIGRSVNGYFEVSTKNAIASGVTIRGTIIYVAK